MHASVRRISRRSQGRTAHRPTPCCCLLGGSMICKLAATGLRVASGRRGRVPIGVGRAVAMQRPQSDPRPSRLISGRSAATPSIGALEIPRAASLHVNRKGRAVSRTLIRCRMCGGAWRRLGGRSFLNADPREGGDGVRLIPAEQQEHVSTPPDEGWRRLWLENTSATGPHSDRSTPLIGWRRQAASAPRIVLGDFRAALKRRPSPRRALFTEDCRRVIFRCAPCAAPAESLAGRRTSCGAQRHKGTIVAVSQRRCRAAVLCV